VELMEIDMSSWVVLLVMITLNAARDHFTPKMADGSHDAQSSHWLYIVLGYAIMLGFFAIYQRLNRCMSRLLQLSGCEAEQGCTWNRADGAAQVADMCRTLERLHTSNNMQNEALSMEQVKSELRDWEEANTHAAKQALKKDLSRQSLKRTKTATEETTSLMKQSRRGSRSKFDIHAEDMHVAEAVSQVAAAAANSAVRQTSVESATGSLKAAAASAVLLVESATGSMNAAAAAAAVSPSKVPFEVGAAGAVPNSRQLGEVKLQGQKEGQSSGKSKWSGTPLELVRVSESETCCRVCSGCGCSNRSRHVHVTRTPICDR
jgi:hypothetical protein